jgi:hypothetical protein
VVKFPENPQGERVLANEFICCALAERLELPINLPVLVSVDGRLIRDPQKNGPCPAEFTGGIRCGMIRFADAEHANEKDVSAKAENAADLHLVAVFEQLVARGDGRQLLLYPAPDAGLGVRRFAAFDYGFAFGGSPDWTIASVEVLPAPVLPTTSPVDGASYGDGSLLEPIVTKLKTLSRGEALGAIMKVYPPRWGVTVQEAESLSSILAVRAASLIDQYQRRFQPQTEAFDAQG